MVTYLLSEPVENLDDLAIIVVHLDVVSATVGGVERDHSARRQLLVTDDLLEHGQGVTMDAPRLRT
jgi:hypothetical protein